MARRTTQSANNISLFPFLAVLVCAMGSLILLLLIITQNVRPQQNLNSTSATIVTPTAAELDRNPLKLTGISSAELQTVVVDQQPEEPLYSAVPLAAQPEENTVAENSHVMIPTQDAPRFQPDRDQGSLNRTAVRQQEQSRAQLLAAVAQKKKLLQLTAQKIQAAQQQQQELTAALQQQQMALENLKKQAQPAQEKLQAEAIQQLKQALSERQQELTRLKSEMDNRKEKIEIVTYDGTSGAKRQPIFIECRATEVIFHPEQVAIPTMDLENLPIENSPLAAGVIALAEYRKDQLQLTDPPYVLMIARPNGIKEYYGCGTILGTNQIAFGYELVEQERELYFGPPDPQARKILLDAIEQAKQDSQIPASRFSRMHQVAERMRPLTGRSQPPAPTDEPSPSHRWKLLESGETPPSPPSGANRPPQQLAGQFPPAPLSVRPFPEQEQLSHPAATHPAATPADQRLMSRAEEPEGRTGTAQPPQFPKAQFPAAEWAAAGTGSENQSPHSQRNREKNSQSDSLTASTNSAAATEFSSQSTGSQYTNSQSTGNQPAGRASVSTSSENRSGTASMSESVPLSSPSARSTEDRTLEALLNQASRNASPSTSSDGGSPFNRSPSSGKPVGSSPSHGAIRIEQTVSVKISPQGIQMGQQPFTPWPASENEEVLERLFWHLLKQEIASWEPPPQGIEWLPKLALQVAPGGNRQAFRLEAFAEKLTIRTSTAFAIDHLTEQPQNRWR